MGRLALSPEEHAISSFSPVAPAEAMPKFFPTQSSHKNSGNTLEVATLHIHRTAEMGILESPLTSQPKALKKVPKDFRKENGQLANCTIWPLFSGR